MTLDFAKFETVEQAQKAAGEVFPPGKTTRSEVEKVLESWHVKLHSHGANILNAKIILPSQNLVHTVWMIRFEFNPNSTLTTMIVSKGFTGP